MIRSVSPLAFQHRPLSAALGDPLFSDRLPSRTRRRSAPCVDAEMLFLVGLGLADEKDITVKGLECIRMCDRVYLENYTSVLHVDRKALEAFYGKDIEVSDREAVELEAESMLNEALSKNVAFLVVGDPFGARHKGVGVQIIHNASILNAVGSCGLQLYNFGRVVSIPFFTENWRPDSFYDKIAENDSLSMHTLCLLDIKVKEQSEENLLKGRKIYEPPRYMSANQAISQLAEVEAARGMGVFAPERHIVVLARVGSASQLIKYGRVSELQAVDFGPELHSLIIPSRSMHELEAKVLATLYA